MCRQELVSIIMPSYNTGKFISQSIQSVLAQTYTNWELLLVDDASTDDTDEVIRPFLADSRIRFYKNEKNSGAAVSRNKALREARGKWIAFLDSDDLWAPEKLEKQIRFMNENGYCFSYTNYAEIDEDGRNRGVLVTGPPKITRTGFSNYNWAGCLTVMYDAEAVGLVQVANIRKNNDYAMWLMVSRKADCFLLDEELAFYRKRAGSIRDYNGIVLAGWLYTLHREAGGQKVLAAVLSMARNMLFGVYKKLAYRRGNTLVGKESPVG